MIYPTSPELGKAMDTRKLLLAVRLGETLHFGKTAEIENIAQSGLSAQISKLESELGFKIFNRANRRVTLTEAGDKFINQARMILDNMDNCIVECKELAESNRKILKIGFFADQASDHTHGLFSLFKKLNPDISLVFHELQMTNQIQSLISGNIDVALIRLPAYDDRLEYVDLFEESRVAVVPYNSELAECSSLSVKDLLDKPFAIPADGAPADLIAYWSLADIRNEPSRVAARVRTIPEVLTAVAYSGAYDTFPTSLSKVCRHPGVKYIPLTDASSNTMSLTTLYGNRTPAVRALRSCAAHALGINI